VDDERELHILSRRRFLYSTVAVGTAVVVGACSDDDGEGGSATPTTRAPASAASPTVELQPTPACDDGDEATPAQTEGPFFTPDSPERADLTDGVDGTPLALSGVVVDASCRPIGGALVDFWQADDDGNYDNEGYRLRGHVFADDQGRYQMKTIVPGLYPGRTRHIHVKAQRPGGRILTTQLYFPGEPDNASDGIFREECLLDVRDSGGGKAATFTFVLT
jgi:protocatechuate 3,4-dioxygenase beta subunit